MKVSILLTSYNLESYIDESIASVVKQEMPFEWELLIGDDGSNDKTLDIINDWISKYPNNIKLFTTPRNSNITKIGSRAAKNRARLLENAQGDYIQFLDGDDKFLGINKIKEQVLLLDDPFNNDCSCSAHNIQVNLVEENRQYFMNKKVNKTRKFSLSQYWGRHYFHTNTILFRSDCKRLLLNEQYRDYLNDNFITYVLLQFGNIYYVNEVWAQYNITGDGLWTGQKGAYGAFRNLQLYDLELKVNPSMAKLSMLKHYGDIQVVNKYYLKSDYSRIYSLIENTDPTIFQITFLLSKIDNLTEEESCQKKKIFFRANLVSIIYKIECAFKKCLRFIGIYL